MKKFFALIFLVHFGLFADPFTGENVDTDLEVVYSYQQESWTMGLSDGSSWKLLPLKEKRKKTWTEWWNDEEPAEWELPEEFFFDPYSWKGHYTISVHKAKNSLTSTHNYVLVNQQTGQKVFAEFIPYGDTRIPREEHATQLIEDVESRPGTVLTTYGALGNVLILEDNSVWELHLISENQRSWSEWWNDVEIDQPDAVFISEIQNWKNTDKVEIYQTKPSDKGLCEKYSLCKGDCELFLIKNKTRRKIAYASAISMRDFVYAMKNYTERELKRAYSRGYSDGYTNGHNHGYDTGYNRGYSAGEKERYRGR